MYNAYSADNTHDMCVLFMLYSKYISTDGKYL